AQPAARRDGRHRQPAVLPADDDEPRQQDARRAVRDPTARRPCQAPAPAGEAEREPDLLHRRDERPDGDARPGAHATGAHWPPRRRAARAAGAATSGPGPQQTTPANPFPPPSRRGPPPSRPPPPTSAATSSRA